MIGAVGEDKAVLVFIECLGADLGVNIVPEGPPFFDGSVGVELFGKQDGSVEGYPGHHLGVGELLGFAAGFPDAFVGLLPDGFEMLKEGNQHAEFIPGATAEGVLGLEEAVEHFAVDVELNLAGCRVADAHGEGVFIAGEPADFPLEELAFALEAVHDLDLVGTAGEGAEEPVLPRGRFGEVAAIGEGEEGEGGVAQPAVAVVPVADAADGLGQGGGDRGDDAAGGAIDHGAQGDEGAFNDVAILAFVFEAMGPALPAFFAGFEGLEGVDFAGIGLVGAAIGEGEMDSLALGDGKFGDRLHVFAVHGNGGAEDGEIGAGNGADSVFDVGDPGDGSAVVEAEGHFHADGDAAANAFDDADDVGVALADGHEVDEPEGACGALEGGFQDERVGAVAAGCFPFAGGGGDAPVAVFFVAEEGGETGVGGEVGPAEPVDGAVSVDEGGGFAIADQGVVFDSCCHRFWVARSFRCVDLGIASTCFWLDAGNGAGNIAEAR